MVIVAAVQRCSLCDARCDTADFCFGCGSHICAACDNPDPDKCPQEKPHKPQDHRKREEVQP